MTSINYIEFQAGQGVSAPALNENFTLTNTAIETLSVTLNSAVSSLTSTTNLKANKNGSSSEKFSVADATETANAVNLGQLNSAVSSLTPVGTVIWFAGSSVPSGYLLCNGANVSRTTYSALFAVIGVIYGAGDSTTTFTLPQLTDNRFIRGAAASGSYQNSNIAAHTHSVTYNAGAYTSAKYSAGDEQGYAKQEVQTTNTGSTGSGSDTYPKNLSLLPCIKY